MFRTGMNRHGVNYTTANFVVWGAAVMLDRCNGAFCFGDLRHTWYQERVGPRIIAAVDYAVNVFIGCL